MSIALANLPNTAVWAKPSRPINASRFAWEIFPSWRTLSISDAHVEALSGDSERDRVILFVGAGKWADNPKKVLCVPITDFAFFSDSPMVSKNSVKAAMVMAASGAMAKKPKSSKYPIVGIKRIRHAKEAIILDRQL